MQEVLEVRGGVPLIGEIEPVGNKNSILKAIPATILTDKDCILNNIPHTTDVVKLLEMLSLLGAKIDTSKWDLKEKEIIINCKNIKSNTVDFHLGSLIRSSIMFAGPLLARFGMAKIPLPGGCVLGQRAIHAHIDGFTKAGCTIEFDKDYVIFKSPKKAKNSYEIWQNEASVTGTENLILYAAGTNAKFDIIDAACEPHTQELEQIISSMGAIVDGIGSNKLNITGSKSLVGFKYKPGPDQIDIAGIIVAAAITKGKIRIKNSNVKYVTRGMIQSFRKFNIGIIEDDVDLVIDGTNKLYIDHETSGFPLANKDLPKFAPRPWPGFPVDALPVVVALACKTHGKLLINNWMFETGLNFINELNSIGANIFMSDPMRVIVYGPTHFKGGRISMPDIIQAGKSIFLCSLADDVVTVLTGVEVLKRRYPDILNTYKRLGAKIEVV